MGKLGKKARKFAKKNLPGVLRQRRKNKAIFKKRSSYRAGEYIADDADKKSSLGSGRDTNFDDIEAASIDRIFAEDGSDEVADASESDGYLSEDFDIPATVGGGAESNSEDDLGISKLSTQNETMLKDLALQKKKLDKLRKKDEGFGRFLEKYSWKISENDDTDSDEDEISHRRIALANRNKEGTLVTGSLVQNLSEVVSEKGCESGFITLLNAYRAACHYGAESVGCRIQNSETFCEIVTVMLTKADSVFRGLLQISSSKCKKETIVELTKSSKWKKWKPLVKSYLRSSLHMLNQVTDSEILAFCLKHLRVSLVLFAAFPSLLPRLIKTAVHLWATGGGLLSSASFLIIWDVASIFGSDCFDSCLAKCFLAYSAQCRVPEIVNGSHINFLRNSFVELCSLDMSKSSAKALASIGLLTKMLQWSIVTKNQDAAKQICSWEYVNFVDLWVMFISVNIRDYDLQSLLFSIIQLINGLAYLFPGPRYFPLRLKCINWLNNLSYSSGVFIPVASWMLDVLEYKIVKEGGRSGSTFNFNTVLKLPKHILKSQTFQEECLFSTIGLTIKTLAQWSFHISFPELATIPLTSLRKFHDSTSVDGMRRMVKRFIEQVEQNVDFVQKKRDEVAFSPNNHQSVDSFLQVGFIRQIIYAPSH
ncbi:hypothetical protein Leryth_024890 [Lithospermum erythrorhizon]|nr:hypothetical protein Leryth_024890 [Lithospermum erythrorhizon]